MLGKHDGESPPAYQPGQRRIEKRSVLMSVYELNAVLAAHVQQAPRAAPVKPRPAAKCLDAVTGASQFSCHGAGRVQASEDEVKLVTCLLGKTASENFRPADVQV